MISKQPNKVKNLEIFPVLQVQACSEFFCSWWLFCTHSQRKDRKPSLWTLGREKHLIPDNLINSHLSCQSPPGLKDALCHTLLRLLSNQRGVKQESKARERERGSEKKEREKGLFKWCYLSLPSSLAIPAHSKSFTSVVHITLRTHGTPLSFPLPIWSF